MCLLQCQGLQNTTGGLSVWRDVDGSRRLQTRSKHTRKPQPRHLPSHGTGAPRQAAVKGGGGRPQFGSNNGTVTKAAVAKLCSRFAHVASGARYRYFSRPGLLYRVHKVLRLRDVVGGCVAFVPISTVEHDNEMLKWGRKGVPLCAAGPACAATALANNMGALHAYQLPNDSIPQMFCLLCIRQDIEGLVMSVQARSKTAGACPIIVPPFKNEMGPGGYAESAFGVTPHNQSVFVGNVWIARASNALEVKLNAETGQCFVDQGPLVYRQGAGNAKSPSSAFLSQGAAGAGQQ